MANANASADPAHELGGRRVLAPQFPRKERDAHPGRRAPRHDANATCERLRRPKATRIGRASRMRSLSPVPSDHADSASHRFLERGHERQIVFSRSSRYVC
jgi:hypothetical protein